MTQFVRHLDFGGTHASLVQHNDRGTKALARIVATSAASLHGLPQDMLFPRTFWRADGRQYATRHNMRSTEGANGQPVAARGVQGWEKNVASGEVSDVAQVLHPKAATGSC